MVEFTLIRAVHSPLFDLLTPRYWLACCIMHKESISAQGSLRVLAGPSELPGPLNWALGALMPLQALRPAPAEQRDWLSQPMHLHQPRVRRHHRHDS